MSFRKPFRAPPLRDRQGNVIPFKATKTDSGMRITGYFIVFLAVFLIGLGLTMRYDIPFLEPSAEQPQTLAAPAATSTDILSASFGHCDGPQRINCVVDGDTFWFAGDKIRILDINTPETSSPKCDQEYALGMRATNRLRELLNAGPFSLEADGENTDRYGRLLRRVTRGGQSLGEVLVNEGLAERWKGYKGNWC